MPGNVIIDFSSGLPLVGIICARPLLSFPATCLSLFFICQLCLFFCVSSLREKIMSAIFTSQPCVGHIGGAKPMLGNKDQKEEIISPTDAFFNCSSEIPNGSG